MQNYTNTISGETQTEAEWMAEIESEGYNDIPDRELTVKEYFDECVENGGLYPVD